MKNFDKIVLVSLCESFTREVARELSKTLEMMFCDASDLLQYQLADRQTLEELWDKAYLDAQEKKVMQQVASFENVVVAANFDLFARHEKILGKNAAVVFVELSNAYVKKFGNKIDAVAYKNRTEKLRNLSNITVKIVKTDTNFVCNKILNALAEIV